jgi:hypothetical protein
MAFKMNGMNFGKGSGSSPKKAYGNSPKKAIYGTSARDLGHLSLSEKTDYLSWKKKERQAGRKGADHDNTYEAYLRSKGKKKTRSRGRGSRIGDFIKNLFTPKFGGGTDLDPTTIAQRKKYQDFLKGKNKA